MDRQLSAVGSVSIITVNPISVATVTTGLNLPVGILYDGANIWVTDIGDNTLKQFDSNGAVLQSVSVEISPQFPAFDGTNIWVPNLSSSTVSVVRASTGAVIATLSGNGLNQPVAAAFDGERILVTNICGNSVSLWKATDLTPIGTFLTGAVQIRWGHHERRAEFLGHAQ
jgi:DNA-binding beta-propeller fold protein YncE